MYSDPKLFTIESQRLLVFPFAPGMEDSEKLISEVYEIFSDRLVIEDYPEKKITDVAGAEGWLSKVALTTILK